jgi:hypoxanthine-guanine phosphoribosyltransferase
LHDAGDLVNPATKITKFIKENNFRIVVVEGTSAQMAAFFVKEIWKKLYPSLPQPNFVMYNYKKQGGFNQMAASFKGVPKSSKLIILTEISETGKRVDALKNELLSKGFSNIKTASLISFPRVVNKFDIVGMDSVFMPWFMSKRKWEVEKIREYRSKRINETVDASKLLLKRSARRAKASLVKDRIQIRRAVKSIKA